MASDVVHVFGHYTLTTTALLVNGTPHFEEHHAVGQWIQRVRGASQFWWGDWLAYGERRPDFQERLSQAVDATGFAEETLGNFKYVCENVPPSRRRDGMDFSTAVEVAPLPPAEQIEVIERVMSEGLTVKKTRAIVKAKRHAAAGTSSDFWLVVKCTDATDQQTLADRMELEGRSCRLTVTKAEAGS